MKKIEIERKKELEKEQYFFENIDKFIDENVNVIINQLGEPENKVTYKQTKDTKKEYFFYGREKISRGTIKYSKRIEIENDKFTGFTQGKFDG